MIVYILAGLTFKLQHVELITTISSPLLQSVTESSKKLPGSHFSHVSLTHKPLSYVVLFQRANPH